jgi:hypothetical protein
MSFAVRKALWHFKRSVGTALCRFVMGTENNTPALMFFLAQLSVKQVKLYETTFQVERDF